MFGLLRGLKDRDIADNCGNLKMLLSEAAYSKGKPNKIKTSIYKLNFSYTHGYKWYAEKSGIETVKCEIIRPYYPYEDFPMHENTVHYFYSGKTTQFKNHTQLLANYNPQQSFQFSLYEHQSQM